MLRTLWDRHGARLRHWLAVLVTIVLVITYMELRDSEADWTVFVLAVGLLLVFEYAFSGDWLRWLPRRRSGRDGPLGPRT
jgi:hypothetical protein